MKLCECVENNSGFRRDYKLDDQSYLYLKRKILKLTNIDLDSYKSQQMLRRLGMFLTHTGVQLVVYYCYMLYRNNVILQKHRNIFIIN